MGLAAGTMKKIMRLPAHGIQFHHGGKVREQDIQVLRDKFASGQAQGKKMPNLAALLERYERHVAAG